MVVLFFVNGKLLGLLTIMFGVGLQLKYQQALRRGTAWPGVYLWTIVFLGLEGLLHYTLVMEYDILMSYAVTAFIVAFIVRLGDKFMTGAFYFWWLSHPIDSAYFYQYLTRSWCFLKWYSLRY